ncbi:unnamed protein product [Closterium sp. NIES-64]|nr:unnamed protein product [Closterium sp. NIES-64]CAI5952223.1 unnamed protein product [Closterium sp. NIES-64]CAI5998627.1 unnamed protein product [Closterium sp. NIES-64]
MLPLHAFASHILHAGSSAVSSTCYTTTAAEAAVGEQALHAWDNGRLPGGRDACEWGGESERGGGDENGLEGIRVRWEGDWRVRVASSFWSEEAVAVMQPHDGIRGMVQQHVTDDNSARLYRTVMEPSAVLTTALANLIVRGAIPPSPDAPPHPYHQSTAPCRQPPREP